MIIAILDVALDPLDVLTSATAFILLVLFHFRRPLFLFPVAKTSAVRNDYYLPQKTKYVRKELPKMSLFVIADLHLSSDGTKSMEKFGARWTGYMQKLEKNWRAVVKETDTVIVPGDVSWSLKLEESLDDLKFLDSLPGTKLIGKGNHDFWWATASKMKFFFEEHHLSTLKILYNNAYLLEGCIVCGTRGWFVEEAQQNTVGTVDYARIVNRELVRLRMSLDDAVKVRRESTNESLPILVFLHFPPVWNEFVCREFIDTLKEYGIETCYFGHIHGAYHERAKFRFEGIEFIICAADYLNFVPLLVQK